MKKTKRISAFVLVLAMLVNLVPAALTGTTAEAADSTEAVRYVSATGDDSTNDGLTEDTAYASIKQAITDLESVTADSKVVKIVGSYVWVKDEISTHTGMITITGADTDAELYLNGTDSRYIKGGALTIENIALRYGAGTQKGIYAFGNEVVIGEGVVLEAEDGTVPGSVGTIWARLGAGAYYGGTSQTAPASLTLNAGHFYDVFLGNEAIPSNTTLPGVNFTMNGGRANMIQVGASGAGKNCYTGNINITINGCDMPSYPPNLIFAGASEATITNKVDLGGNAIQVIVNNGLSINDGTIPVNATNVATAGGTLYYIKSASATDGSTLETTETTGVYKVNGDMIAVATDSASNTYTSVDGTLTLPAAGTYNVSWRDTAEIPTVVYVDSTNGVDTNDGSETAPVKTMKQAMSMGSEQIKVIGTYALKAYSEADYTSHTQMITISGSDETAQLDFAGNCFVQGGPVTFENIIFNFTGTWQTLLAQGNETVIGSGVTVLYKGAEAEVNTYNSIVATGSTGAVQSGQGSGAQSLTLNSGNFDWVCIGNYDVNTDVSIPGANLTVNPGAKADEILLGGGYGSKVQTYTGNVNITFNGGEVTQGVRFESDYDASRAVASVVAFDGNALQLIYNNGVEAVLGDDVSQATIEERGGVYYQLNCAAQTGSTLEATETAGTYKVNGENLAVATNAADESIVYTSTASGVLTVETPGTYNVTWKKNTATVIYIDQTNGSDSNAGTEAAPVQSLKQAEALIVAAGSEQNSIKIVGEYVWKANADADFTTHTEMITVSGSDADAKLTIGGNRFIEGGPMTLENIILNYTVDEYGIYAIGNETVIGSGVTVQSSDAAKPNISQFKPILASGTHYGGKTGQTSGVQKLTLSGGRFLQVFLGDNYLSGASNVEGVNFTMNEGSTAFDIIIGGGGGTPALTYSGDVNLTFNGGNLVNTVKMTRTDVTRVDFGGNAVQIICNNGTTPTLDATIGQDRVTNRNGKYYQMNCEAVSGSGLAVTANEGVYTVVGDKLAIAVNQADKSKTYVSMDGTLTVAAEGIYTVSFVDDADYLNLGNQIVVYKDVEIDLSGEDAATVEGKVFVGWADADGNGASGTSFTAGTVLTASYIDYDPNVDLTTVGSSLYKVADPGTDQESLRFCTSLSFALVKALGGSGAVTYGTVYMDSETLGSNTLTTSTTGVSHTQGSGNEIYITDSATVYGATVSNVSYANRSKEYTYRGYVSFADINGFTRELYTDAMTVSVSDTAQHVLERVGSKLVEAEGFKPYFMELATEYEEYIAYRTPLANTYKKLTEDKELNIVYLGGSVTAGYGSSNQDSYSWRALSGKWFKENFPDANITTVNAAIGESGTFLGTYRIDEDLISQQPDLFFIEYAINDYYKGCDREVAALQYETIVREIKTAYPDCDFITLLVTDWTAKDETTEDGDLFPEAQGHMDIAEAYGISSINVGKSLVDSLGDQSGYSSCSESAEWMEHFIDIVHPTDAGYKKYYDCLEEYLRTSLLYDIPEGSSTIALPAVQSSHLLDGNRQSYFGEQMQAIVTDSSGFTYSDALWFGSNMDTPHYGYYYSQNSDTDAYITFTFTGTEVAIWTSFYTNSKIEYTIDDGTPVEMNCHRHAPTQIITGLESGTHTIKIRPTNYADGPMMKIGAVFARDESAQTLKGATK